MIEVLNKNDYEYFLVLEKLFPQDAGNISNRFLLNPYANIIIYIFENEVVGFLNFDVIFDRCEIININVANKFQRQGIASKLLNYMFEKINDVKNVTLEVRDNNIGAIKLYEKFNFKVVAIRKNYYNNRDGLLMEKEMM